MSDDAPDEKTPIDAVEAPAADFECRVVAHDEAVMQYHRRLGHVVYVQVEQGALPTAPRNVLVRAADNKWQPVTLLPRPRPGELVPVPATLIVPQGRIYAVTVLCVLPPLAAMRPHLRSGFHPPMDLDPAAVPLALEGLTRHFRAVGSRLLSGAPAPTTAEYLGELYSNTWDQPDWARLQALRADRLQAANGDVEALARLVETLNHEQERLRNVAAGELLWVADRLPVAPFLDAVRDKSELNVDTLVLAGRVFGLHASEVPVEAVLDLYHTELWGDRVQVEAVRALGYFGDRAPLNLLIDLMTGPQLMSLVVRAQAALALERLGDRVPIDVFVQALDSWDRNVREIAARVILARVGLVTDDVRATAEQIARQALTFKPPHP